MEGKRFVRSRDRWLGGICGGSAEYMNLPKDRVRLAWLILTLFLGIGLLAYIILWIIMPEEENNIMKERKLVRSRDRWLAGICGGIAEYMGWSKDYVRLAWLLLTLFTAFSGLIVYIILWIVMPEDNNNLYNNNYNKV